MSNLIEIKNDCYDICSRIKEIDRSYQIFFNLSRRCYEVHSCEQYKSSFCFTIPNSEIDERVLILAKKTRKENQDQLIKEIEEDNRQLEMKNLKKQVEILKEIVCL